MCNKSGQNSLTYDYMTLLHAAIVVYFRYLDNFPHYLILKLHIYGKYLKSKCLIAKHSSITDAYISAVN